MQKESPQKIMVFKMVGRPERQIPSERISCFQTKRSQRISCDLKIKGIMLGLHDSKNCILRKERIIVKNPWNRMKFNAWVWPRPPVITPIKSPFRPLENKYGLNGDGGNMFRIRSIGMHPHST